MNDFAILGASTRLLHLLALVAGVGLVTASGRLVRRKLQANDDARGAGSVSWPVVLVIAAIPCAVGAGLVWMPFQFVRFVGVSPEAFEVRYLFPRTTVRHAMPDVQRVLLVESCELLRSGWRTRSTLEITLRSGGRVDGIEGERQTLITLAERLTEYASLEPEYEVRNAELAREMCVTASPW